MAIQHPTQIIKSQDTIVYVGALSGATRPVITLASGGTLTRPSSGVPSDMYYLGGVTNASVAINDGEQEYYLLGNGGFADSVKVTTRAQASITSYFQKTWTALRLTKLPTTKLWTSCFVVVAKKILSFMWRSSSTMVAPLMTSPVLLHR